MGKYLIPSALTLLLFSACSHHKAFPAMPQLQTWEVKPIDRNITYEVFEVDP